MQFRFKQHKKAQCDSKRFWSSGSFSAIIISSITHAPRYPWWQRLSPPRAFYTYAQDRNTGSGVLHSGENWISLPCRSRRVSPQLLARGAWWEGRGGCPCHLSRIVFVSHPLTCDNLWYALLLCGLLGTVWDERRVSVIWNRHTRWQLYASTIPIVFCSVERIRLGCEVKLLGCGSLKVPLMCSSAVRFNVASFGTKIIYFHKFGFFILNPCWEVAAWLI